MDGVGGDACDFKNILMLCKGKQLVGTFAKEEGGDSQVVKQYRRAELKVFVLCLLRSGVSVVH